MDTKSTHSASPLLYLIAGFLLGAVTVGGKWLTTREAGTDIVRDVTMDYIYEYEPGLASGHDALAVAMVEHVFQPCLVGRRQVNLDATPKARPPAFAAMTLVHQI